MHQSATMSSVPVNELPTEILQKTLRYLPPLDLIRGRRVCLRWRDVVDSVVNEEFWCQLCRQDFPSIYKDARLKCDPSLSWHELHKSLHLWKKLDVVDEENWIPICSYPKEEDFGATWVSAIEGKLCVHEIYKLVYYNLKGEKVKEYNTEWEQIFFRETASVIAYDLNDGPRYEGPIAELVIIKKINGEPDLNSKVVIGDVIDFAVVGEDVYYKKNIPFDEYGRGEFCCQIMVCKPEDNYKSTFVGDIDSDVIAMGCKNDKLHLMTYTYDVFALEENNFVFQEYVGRKSARYTFITYNILDIFGDELLCDEVGFTVSAYYVYMDMTFLGGEDGILRLYDIEQFLDNARIEPICQFDLAIRLNPVKKYFKRAIMGVDVIEKKNGHIILVGTGKGVFAIELTHSSNRRSARIKKQNSKNCKKIKLR